MEGKGRSDLFEGLSVWGNEQYRSLQGSYPVIFLSFANVKETSYKDAKKKICYIIEKLYNRCGFLMEGTIPFCIKKSKSLFSSASPRA